MPKKGWKREPSRHALAAKGVKTGGVEPGLKRHYGTYHYVSYDPAKLQIRLLIVDRKPYTRSFGTSGKEFYETHSLEVIQGEENSEWDKELLNNEKIASLPNGEYFITFGTAEYENERYKKRGIDLTFEGLQNLRIYRRKMERGWNLRE
jgi:hypothetical protein